MYNPTLTSGSGLWRCHGDTADFMPLRFGRASVSLRCINAVSTSSVLTSNLKVAHRNSMDKSTPCLLSTSPPNPSVQSFQLTKDIKACKTQTELHKLIQSVPLNEINKLHTCAALTHLAQLHHSSDRIGKPHTTQGLGMMLVNQALSFLPRLSPRQASNVAWASSKLHLDLEPDKMQAFLNRSLLPPSIPNSQDLANAIQACAATGHNPSGRWLKVFEDTSLPMLQQHRHTQQQRQQYEDLGHTRPRSFFLPQELSCVLHSFAVLGYIPSTSWLASFETASESTLRQMNGTSLCTVLWAAAQLREQCRRDMPTHEPQRMWPSEPWIESALKAVYEIMPLMSQQELSGTLWAVSWLAPGTRINIEEDPRDTFVGQKSIGGEAGKPQPGWISRLLDEVAGFREQHQGPYQHQAPLSLGSVPATQQGTGVDWVTSPSEGHNEATLPLISVGEGVLKFVDDGVKEAHSLTSHSHVGTSQGSGSTTGSLSSTTGSLSSRNLSNLLCALVRLRYRPTDTWIQTQLTRLFMSGGEHKGLLSSSASPSFRGSTEGAPQPQEMSSSSRLATTQVSWSEVVSGVVGVQDTISILCSCAHLRYMPPRLVAVALLDSAYRGMAAGKTDGQQLVELLWALGRLRLLPSHEWLCRFWFSTLPHLDKLDTDQLSRLLWSVAKLQQQQQQLGVFRQQKQNPIPGRWSSSSIAAPPGRPNSSFQEGRKLKMLQTHSEPLVPQPWATAVLVVLDKHLLRASRPQGTIKSELNAQLFRQLCWALAHAPRTLSLPLQLRVRLLCTSKVLIPNFDVGTLAQLPLLLARVGCSRMHDQCGFIQSLKLQSKSHMQEMSGSQLCQLLSGLAALGCCPDGAWLAGALKHLEAPGLIAAAAANPEALTSLLHALKFFGLNPGFKGDPQQLLISYPRLKQELCSATLIAFKSKRCTAEAPLRLLLTLRQLGVLNTVGNTKLGNTTACDKAYDGSYITDDWWPSTYNALKLQMPHMGGRRLSSILYLLASMVTSSSQGSSTLASHLNERGSASDFLTSTSSGGSTQSEAQDGVFGRGFQIPDTVWIEEILHFISADFESLGAKDVAHLLCALVRLRHDPDTKWLQRLTLMVETRSALFSKADHSLVQKAWLQLGSGCLEDGLVRSGAGIKVNKKKVSKRRQKIISSKESLA